MPSTNANTDSNTVIKRIKTPLQCSLQWIILNLENCLKHDYVSEGQEIFIDFMLLMAENSPDMYTYSTYLL